MRLADSVERIAYRKNLKFKILNFELWFLLFTFSFCLAHAATVTSKDLIEMAESYDHKMVEYAGEAVTAILPRGENCWINLNDGNNAIGVWCDSASAAVVGRVGDYKNKGDIVEVRGIFNRACAEHRGELDIHADSIRVVRKGCAVTEMVEKNKLGFSASIFLITLCLVILFRKRL
jgi:lysyl-tRNA synthetase class II